MIQVETIQTRIRELETAWSIKKSAAESYTLAIEAVAAAAHCEPAALKQYINARMRDKVAELQIQQEQLSLLLESSE